MRHLRGAIGWLLLAGSAAITVSSYAGYWWPLLDAPASFLPMAAAGALLALPFRPRRKRMRYYLAAAATFLLAAFPILGEITAAQPHAPANATRLVVVTHNLEGGGASPGEQARILAASDADILLLQEAASADAQTLRQLLAGRYRWQDACGACELAILSRLPMSPVRWRLPGPNGTLAGPPLYRADLDLAGTGTVTLMTVHAPWPVPADAQPRFRRALIDAMAEQSVNRVILAGDFNLTPWAAGMRALDDGLSPMRRISRARFSFPARIGTIAWPVPLLPIDHLYVGPAIGVGRVDLLPATGSDHRALRAELWVLPDTP